MATEGLELFPERWPDLGHVHLQDMHAGDCEIMQVWGFQYAAAEKRKCRSARKDISNTRLDKIKEYQGNRLRLATLVAPTVTFQDESRNNENLPSLRFDTLKYNNVINLESGCCRHQALYGVLGGYWSFSPHFIIYTL